MVESYSKLLRQKTLLVPVFFVRDCTDVLYLEDVRPESQNNIHFTSGSQPGLIEGHILSLCIKTKCLKAFWLSYLGNKRYYWHLVGRGKDAAKHPSMNRIASNNKGLPSSRR